MFARHPVLSTALVAAFAALSSTAVFAESPTPESTGFQATHTRAEVKAEVLVAAATHRLLPAGEHELVPTPAARFAVSRAQVKADTLSARAAGTLLPAGEIVDGARGTPARAGAGAGAPSVAGRGGLLEAAQPR
jgi:hypothetical protein